MTDEKKHTCPICGYPDLTDEPYHSHEICSCCGNQFGYDDHIPNEGVNDRDSENRKARLLVLRAIWFQNGAKWFDTSRKPKTWSAVKQLLVAGLKLPVL